MLVYPESKSKRIDFIEIFQSSSESLEEYLGAQIKQWRKRTSSLLCPLCESCEESVEHHCLSAAGLGAFGLGVACNGLHEGSPPSVLRWCSNFGKLEFRRGSSGVHDL